MRISSMFTGNGLIVAVLVSGIPITSALALGQDKSVSESDMIMGKYVQREFESFLKPKPQAAPEAITGKELSTTPKDVTKIPEEPK